MKSGFRRYVFSDKQDKLLENSFFGIFWGINVCLILTCNVLHYRFLSGVGQKVIDTNIF